MTIKCFKTQGTTVRWGALLSIAGLFFLALTTLASAQIAGTANIQGTVSDPSGAVIAHAQVTVTNVATGVKHTSASSSGGVFSFPNLTIGTYNLSVKASGFKTYSRTGIVLDVGSNVGINVTMAIGEATQQVTVEANGIALQTQDSNFKQTINAQEINELPLNGRNMTDLVVLAGGATSTPHGDMVGSKNFHSSTTISVAGGQGNETDYRLDGADNNDYMTNVNLPFPFPDAVDQFSVESTAMGAQSGLHPGGEVNVVTKSGTNQFHGDAFEYIRNNYIDATNFFSSKPDQLHQNQFGGTIGGPIRRDKLFFFAGYQRTIIHSVSSDKTAYVPSAANLKGDFSASDSTPLYNPLTGALLTNNQIDPKYFSPVSLALEKYLPQTTAADGKVHYSLPGNSTENQFITRVDLNLSSKNILFARYLLDGYGKPAAWDPTDALVTTTAGNLERVQSLTIGDTYTFNSHIVNSVHIFADRRRDNRVPAAQGISPDAVGINVYNIDPNFFRFSVSSKFSLYCGTCALSHFNVNTYGLSDDVNWVHGKHQVIFGGELVRSQFNASNHYEMNGNFGFSGVFSQKGPAQDQTKLPKADANLDFLTGALSSFEQSKAQQNALRAPIPSLYIQDTYQATRKLVITAGVRWQPEFFPTDYFHRGAQFDETAFLNNIHSSVFPGAPAGVFYYGDKGVPKNYTQNSPWQFSPRFGITYNPDGVGKTVLRMGVALIYDESNFFTSNRDQQNPPFATAASTIPTTTPLDFADPWSGGSAPGNPFPQPEIPSKDVVFPATAQYIVLPKHFHVPYVTQWTASFQRELPHSWMAQLDYVGNETAHQTWGFPLNPAVYTSGSPTANYSTRFRLYLENPSQGGMFTGGGSTALIADSATASYNGLIATVQHRSADFTFLANYTWSHCLDISDASGDIGGGSVEDPYNPRLDRGNCGFDHRSMFNANGVATSRFSSLHGPVAAVVNHWEIGPLLRITDGSVFTVGDGVDISGTDVKRDRPNQVSKNVYTHNNIAQNQTFINQSPFAYQADGTYGNLGRNTFRGPKYVDLDAELSRYFPITERMKMDLRIEAFNVLNHPNFDSPSHTNLNQSHFGVITGSGAARIWQGAVKFIF